MNGPPAEVARKTRYSAAPATALQESAMRSIPWPVAVRPAGAGGGEVHGGSCGVTDWQPVGGAEQAALPGPMATIR
ncbi:MAG: hypothetical protein ABUT39_20620 [Acidobacteriota bacterium]